ncbi:hypothetical protein RE9425_03210 [Prescottella equi]|nr:hypothetical protein RE9425_03210 [Prescottella equi]
MGSKRKDSDGGLRTPDIPEGDDAKDSLAMALYYIRHYLDDFTRGRETNKRKAKRVAVGVAACNAAIVIVGSLTTLTGWSALGVVSAGIAGGISVIAAREGILSNREMWIRRSIIVRQLNEIDRRYRMLELNATNRTTVAADAMQELDDTLGTYSEDWGKFRHAQEQTADK